MQLFLFDPLFRLQGKIRSFRQISGTFFPFLVDFCKDQDETMKHCQRCNGPESLLADSFSKIQQNSLSRPSCRPAQCVGINRERKQRISGCWQMLFGGRIGLPVWGGVGGMMRSLLIRSPAITDLMIHRLITERWLSSLSIVYILNFLLFFKTSL